MINVDIPKTAQNSGIISALVLSLFGTYVNTQQGAGEVEEAETAARIETNIMNTLNNQADEDVNLQGGINRNEAEIKAMKEEFNKFVIEYYKNGGANSAIEYWIE